MLFAIGCSKPSGSGTSADRSALGNNPVVSNAPAMPTGGVHPAPFADPGPNKLLEACEHETCVRISERASTEPNQIVDRRLGTVIGIDGDRAQIRVTGNLSPLGTATFESVVVAAPGEVIPTMIGMARVLDVRVVSPKTAFDPPWSAYVVVQPIDPDWSRPRREHVFVTYRGTAMLDGYSLHLDELRKSLTGDAAVLTARRDKELHFTVQRDTVIELDGERFEILAVQPNVAENIGWVEIDALPMR